MKDRNWGGARHGSGRRTLPKNELKKIRTVKMSDKEWAKIGELADIDYEWYIAEAQKRINDFLRNKT